MQMELDEIIYTAITANETLKTLCGWVPATGSTPEVKPRIKSTTFEVPPVKEDNTPIPYIVIYEEQCQNDQGTKDDVWECGQDIVNVGVEFAGSSPDEVKRLRRLIRKAVDSYVKSNETDILSLRGINYDGVQWFWEKPCYYDTLHYSCDMVNDLNDTEDEQEKN